MRRGRFGCSAPTESDAGFDGDDAGPGRVDGDDHDECGRHVVVIDGDDRRDADSGARPDPGRSTDPGRGTGSSSGADRFQ